MFSVSPGGMAAMIRMRAADNGTARLQEGLQAAPAPPDL
jgi:hypothetical protein